MSTDCVREVSAQKTPQIRNDGTEHGSRVATTEQTLQFLFVLSLILVFFILDIVCLIVYNRQTLFDIGCYIAHWKPDFLHTDNLFTGITSETFVCTAWP